MQGNPFLIHSLPFLITFQLNPIMGTNYWWFLADFNLFFTLDVAVFQSNILATPISCGKISEVCISHIGIRIWNFFDARYIICQDTKLVGSACPWPYIFMEWQLEFSNKNKQACKWKEEKRNKKRKIYQQCSLLCNIGITILGIVLHSLSFICHWIQLNFIPSFHTSIC